MAADPTIRVQIAIPCTPSTGPAQIGDVLELPSDEAMQLLEGGQATPATAHVVTPADGSASVTFGWDGSEQVLAAGTLISATHGSSLEQSIGEQNLTWLAGSALVSSQAGSTGGISN